MEEKKPKRNGRRSEVRRDFQIRSKPIVCVAEHFRSLDVAERVDLPRFYDRPVLFVIAQNEHTIFASWNIDWRCVFKKRMPSGRQVYLRIIDDDGLEEKKIAVEPMAERHYVTISGQHDAYRVEIGYYRPANTWHSVAISDRVQLRSKGTAEIAAVDLATIPFHLSFQKLLDVLRSTSHAPLARAVSSVQKRLFKEQMPNELSPRKKQILQKLHLSLPEIAGAHSSFEKSGIKRLARHAAFLRYTATSPPGGFQAR
jgi:hypothetical protein